MMSSLSTRQAAPRSYYLLVVDDDETVRELLGIQLKRDGHRVCEAADAPKALEILNQERIDLIVLDLNLAGNSGLELLHKIRASHSALDLPVVIISGSDQTDVVVSGLGAGANDFITKPLEVAVVRARIATQLSLKDLKETNDRFFRILGHDLKKPLFVMLDVIRHLRQENPDPSLQSEDLRECLELLNDSGEYIKQLVETLLELRAIHDGRMSLSRSPTDVGAVVRQAVTHSMAYAQSKAIALRMQFDSELPPVQADDLRLMQVLDNLIGNAIKFSPLGKQVLVRTRYENQTILCEVVDEGPGIVESDRAKLFVEYAKLRNKPTGNETSTGLGLSICREFDSAARGYHWHAGQRQRRIDILVPTFAARIEAIAPLGDRLTATLARRRK